MKMAIYPGSFNPWHEGHEDVLNKALLIFDKVILSQGLNPDKPDDKELFPAHLHEKYGDKIAMTWSSGLLVEQLKALPVCAVIKGLRNATDLEYEKTQQYWNEDLGIEIPTVYIITDRKYSHISSSAIRQVRKFKK
jgi:pantetheine-phosphate adenylyltransferase